jgi:DNA-binding MarR family transcriptional regulator
MTRSLQDELRQNRPFKSLEEEALLSIVRTSAVLMDEFERLLRPYGITATQYNVLRILRGSEPHGLSRNELRDRMLTRMPDVTRLLDRMEDAGSVERVRGEDDRRLVTTRITPSALELLAKLDPIVAADQKRRFRGASERDLRSLIYLLATLRDSRGD